MFWEFFADPVMTDLAADVVGPDVKFHHAKLNVKSERGTRGFKWHQDIPAWPHTDYSPVSIGVYIEGCTLEQGPLVFAPGTHEGPLYRMYDRAGNFVWTDFVNLIDKLCGHWSTGAVPRHGINPTRGTRSFKVVPKEKVTLMQEMFAYNDAN